MPRDPVCNCEPCQLRRAAQQRWFEKNRARRLIKNAENKRKRRAAIAASTALVSDAELDRRALEKMPWRR